MSPKVKQQPNTSLSLMEFDKSDFLHGQLLKLKFSISILFDCVCLMHHVYKNIPISFVYGIVCRNQLNHVSFIMSVTQCIDLITVII